MSNPSFVDTNWRVSEMKRTDGQKDAVSVLYAHLYTFICKDSLMCLRLIIQWRWSYGDTSMVWGKQNGQLSEASFSSKFSYIFSATRFPWRVHMPSLRVGPYHCSSVFCYDATIIRLQVPAMMEADFDWWQSWDHNRRQGRIPGIESPKM
jgi:hypothetical protein